MAIAVTVWAPGKKFCGALATPPSISSARKVRVVLDVSTVLNCTVPPFALVSVTFAVASMVYEVYGLPAAVGELIVSVGGSKSTDTGRVFGQSLPLTS